MRNKFRLGRKVIKKAQYRNIVIPQLNESFTRVNEGRRMKVIASSYMLSSLWFWCLLGWCLVEWLAVIWRKELCSFSVILPWLQPQNMTSLVNYNVSTVLLKSKIGTVPIFHLFLFIPFLLFVWVFFIAWIFMCIKRVENTIDIGNNLPWRSYR